MKADSYQIETKDKYSLVKVLSGKFTALVAPELKTALVELKEQGVKNIIFDLKEASYCDSSGLSVVLVANRICKDANGCLVVCNLQPAVAKLIDISQLSNVLNITPSLNEAVDFLFMDELERGLGESDSQLN